MSEFGAMTIGLIVFTLFFVAIGLVAVASGNVKEPMWNKGDKDKEDDEDEEDAEK